MKQESKFNQQEQQQAEELNQAGAKQVERHFTSVEELIRYDAAQVTPPPRLITRLKNSLARQRRSSWWRRWFSP